MSAVVIPFPNAAGVDQSRRMPAIPTIGGNVVLFPRPASRRRWQPSDITPEQSAMVMQWRRAQRRIKAERAAERARKKKGKAR